MAIIIKKRNVTAPEPAPLVARSTVPAPPPAPVAKQPAPQISEHDKKPFATSPEQFSKEPGKYRAPLPTNCTFCGHAYSFPCHGASDKCMNAEFVRSHGGASKNAQK